MRGRPTGAHANHAAAPNFHFHQVLFDDCPVCDWRSDHPWEALTFLDPVAFEHAWGRAINWQKNGDDTLSSNELPVLRVLWSVYLCLERAGLPEPLLKMLPTLGRETWKAVLRDFGLGLGHA